MLFHRWVFAAVAALYALCLPVVLLAQSLPAAGGADQVPYLVELIGRGFADKNWLLVAGAALMLLTILMRGLLRAAGDRPGLKVLLPWLTIGTGVLAAVGAALVAGQGLVAAIVGALTAGAAGIGLWELVGSKIWAAVSFDRAEEVAVKRAAVAGYKAGSLQLQSDGSIRMGAAPGGIAAPEPWPR